MDEVGVVAIVVENSVEKANLAICVISVINNEEKQQPVIMKNTFYSSLFTSLYILNVNAHPHGLRVHLGSCLLGKNGAVLIRK